MSLHGLRVLVTGATSGIGRAVAERLAAEGATLLVTGRREEILRQLAAEHGTRAPIHARSFDLSRTDALVGWLTEFVADTGGPLDAVVHSAGMPAPTPLRVLKAADLARTLELNTTSTALLMSAFLSKKVSNDGATFVALSSVAARSGSGGLGAYAASKAAVEALVRTAASEGRARRLCFNAVAPGYVVTPMQADAAESIPNFAKVTERQFLGLIPAGEIAALCAYLVGPEARRMTGTVITLDAGLSL